MCTTRAVNLILHIFIYSVITFNFHKIELLFLSAGTRIVFNIWKEKTMTPLLMIHLGYGIGSFIAPLYADPFLMDTVDETSSNTTSLHYNNITYSYNESATAYTSTTPEVYTDSNSRVEFPFAISAALAVLVSLFFYFYQLQSCGSSSEKTAEDLKVKDSEKAKEVMAMDNETKEPEPSAIRSFLNMINPSTCAGGRFCYGAQILGLTFAYCGNIAGGDRMIGNYIRTFAVEEAHLSKTNASLLNMAFWIGFSSGRAVFSIVGFFVKVRKLLLMVTGGMAVSGVLLMFLSHSSELSLWVLFIALGFFCAPTWPTGIAWTDYHIELTGLGMTWQILGGSVGGIIHLSVIGYVYEYFGPIGFLYQIAVLCVLQFVISVALTLIGSQHGSRFKQNNTTKEILAQEDEMSKL